MDQYIFITTHATIVIYAITKIFNKILMYDFKYY